MYKPSSPSTKRIIIPLCYAEKVWVLVGNNGGLVSLTVACSQPAAPLLCCKIGELLLACLSLSDFGIFLPVNQTLQSIDADVEAPMRCPHFLS